MVDRFYPSSKTCSRCEVVKDKLPLGDRIFQCEACGLTICRDLNAALNLEKIGWATPELTATDMPTGVVEVVTTPDAD